MIKEKVVIDKHYHVPCVRGTVRRGTRKIWLPILGDYHNDVELGNPNWHYHCDYRFMPDKVFVFLGVKQSNHSIKVLRSDQELEIKYRRLRCVRLFNLMRDGFCGDISEISYKKFELMMGSSKVIERDGCHFCPHKGAQLDDGVRVEQWPHTGTIVECPGHGLTWKLETGELIKCDEE